MSNKPTANEAQAALDTLEAVIKNSEQNQDASSVYGSVANIMRKAYGNEITECDRGHGGSLA